MNGQALRWVALVVAAAIWFALLGYRDLVDPDEGRYADIPRAMVQSGDWVTPRLNGLKYFEKPPLQYWATALSFELLGEGNASARLWLALVGFAGALWVWFLGNRLFGRDAGFFGFLIAISLFLYAVFGHLLTLDMTVSVFMFLGVGALVLAQSGRDRPEAARNWMLLGWLALALAVLSKGLAGVVLPAGAVVVYSLWQRDWALWRHLHLGKGLLLFLLVTAPWFVLVSLRNPEFPDFFFIREHLARYTTTVHGREEPFWYFGLVVLAGSLPWLTLLLRALLRPGFRWWPPPGSGFDAVRFLWVYAGFVVAFFSLGQSKLPPYILPAFPVLALLMGRRLAERPSITGVAAVMGALAAVFLAAGWQIALWERPTIPMDYLEQARPWVLGAGVAMLVGTLGAHLLRGRFEAALVLVSLCALLGFQLLGWGFQGLNQTRSGRALAEAIRPYAEAGAEVYSVGAYYQSVSFYLGRPVTPVIYTGELSLGIEQEPGRWIPDWETFKPVWLAADRAVAIYEAREYPEYADEGLPMRVVYRDPKKVAVVKP